MAEEVSLPVDCCANCSAPFGGGNVIQNNDANSESLVIKNRARIKTIIAEINGKDQAVQVVDALAEIYNLNWLERIEIEDDDQILTGELTVCSECSYVFSQLYKWFAEFQLLRKADSILSSRLSIINSFVDQLLASSNGQTGNGDAVSDANDDTHDLMDDDEVIQNEMCEFPLELPGIVRVKRERDFDEFFPRITSSESIRHEEHEDLMSANLTNLEAIGGFGTDTLPSDLLGSTEMEQTTTESLGPVPSVRSLRRIKFESAIVVEDEEIFRLGQDQSESDVAMTMEGINQPESGLPTTVAEEVNQPVTVFKCTDCDEQFSKAFQLGAHRKDVHGPNEVFKCHVCSQVLSSSGILRYHVMRHSDVRPYNCHLCSGTYKTKIDLGSHIRDYHTTKGRQRRHKARLRHRRKSLQRTTGGGNHKCNICRRGGFSARGLYSHKIQCHGITAKKASAKSQSSLPKKLPHPGFYECHYCGQIFSDGSVFHSHLRSHTEQVVESSIRSHTQQAIESSIRSHTEQVIESSIRSHTQQAIDSSIRSHTQQVIESSIRSQIAIQSSEPTSEDSSSIAVASIAALTQQIPVSTGLYGVTVTAVEPTRRLRGDKTSKISSNQPSRSFPTNSHLLSALTSNSSSTSKNHHGGLLHHLLKRKTQEKFSCNRCTEEFDTATALGLHQFKVHNTSNKCKICKKGFPNQKSLNNHMVRHKETAQHTASPEKQVPAGLPELLPILVSSQPTTAATLKSDSQGTTATAAELSDPSVEPVCEYKCIDCDQVFTEGKDLGTHRKQEHGSLDRYKCHICGNVSSKPSRLKMHLLRHSANRKFVCQTCGKGFVVVYDLRRHQKRTGCKSSELPTAELKTMKPEEKMEVFGCNMCTRAFGSASNLAGHYTSAHVVDFSFQCTMCSGLVDTENEWKEHLATHFTTTSTSTSRSRSRTVQCPICHKVLSSSKNLGAHVKRHTDERNYQCELCMKTFKVSNDLARHRRRYHAVLQRTTWEHSNGPEDVEHFMSPLIGVEPNSEEASTSDMITFE